MTMRFEHRIIGTALAAGILLAAPLAAARQEAPTQEPPKTEQPPAEGQAPAQPAPGADGAPKQPQFHPGLKLGLRARNVRMQIAVAPVVVIVPDVASYVEAIGNWQPRLRYPVLIDDGSLAAREDIARFVRGFKPTTVVRWTLPPEQTKSFAGPERAKLVEHSVARAWGAKPETMPKYLIEYWKSMGFVSPGIVVTSMGDRAWPAALALAAGHGQPIVWYDTAGDAINGELLENECDALAAAIEGAAEASGLKWGQLGDEIDAVTLCLNMAAKYKAIPDPQLAAQVPVKPGDVAAVTDRIGRHREGGALAQRWGWAGQIYGNESRSAYRAMCALFIDTTSAWLFDGYPPGQAGFSDYDCTKAAEFLTAAGLTVTLDDAPHQGRSDWRARASKPLDAGLVLVNTSGMSNFFDLQPGKGRCGDTPLLTVPAMVRIVHSWSLAYPGGRDTVAGRWLDNGAYALFGSVQEPFLSAFVPTPLLAQKLVPFNKEIFSGFAWGAAGRNDGQPLWRVACMGDPLITIGRPAPRAADSTLPLSGAASVDTEMRDAVKTKKFARAIELLTILGDDERAAKLAAAVFSDQPAQFTAEVAAVSILPLARTGRADILPAAYAKLDAKTAADGMLQDGLWLGTIESLKTSNDRALLNALRRNLRPSQAARDALDLIAAFERILGKSATISMLTEVRDALRDTSQRKELDDAIKGYR